MIMHEIESTAVREIGYDWHRHELHVRFVSGPTIYVYENVPFYMVGAIFKSKSKGQALNRHILRKKEFRRGVNESGADARADA